MKALFTKITVLFAIILSLFISGEPYNVAATVNGEVTSESQVISVTVKNDTGKTINLVAPVVKSVEKEVDGIWETVGFAWLMEDGSRVCYPTQEVTTKISLSSYDISSLSAGEYRLSIPYSVKTKEETIHTYAYAYFNVNE